MRQQPIALLPKDTQDFIILWRVKKHRPYSSYICLCEIDEILEGSPAHFKDTSFSGSLTFDHIIDLKQMKIGYDGEKRMEIALYYLNQYVKERIKAVAKTQQKM